MTTKEHLWNKLPKNPKFLIIKLRSIGDVIYNTAVYTPLKKRFPDSHLSVLVEQLFTTLINIIPLLINFYVSEKNHL